MDQGHAQVITEEGRGPHVLLLSTLCARCPMGEAGCCATPPAIEWSDLARIASLGGAPFLLDKIADGSLKKGPRGLFIHRVAPREGMPLRCAFHGPRGCTIPPDRRSMTCNFYVCEDALAFAGEPKRPRRTRDGLMEKLGRWDIELAERVKARWPEGPTWDEAFFDWLSREAREVSRGAIGGSITSAKCGSDRSR